MNRFYGPLIGLAALLLLGCPDTETNAPSSSSESHFLEACVSNSDCPSELQCLCSVCTTHCTADAECSALPNAVCAPAEEVTTCVDAAPTPMLCVDKPIEPTPDDVTEPADTAPDAQEPPADDGAPADTDVVVGPADSDVEPDGVEPDVIEPDNACPPAFAGCETYVPGTFVGFWSGPYEQPCIEVVVGQDITFYGPWPEHPLQQACGASSPLEQAPTDDGGTWVISFDTPGIYGYFCTEHGDATGGGHAGAIRVVPPTGDVPDGEPCTKNTECQGGSCPEITGVCGPPCNAGATNCPDGMGCFVPGDVSGVCLTTCSQCGVSDCGPGRNCIPSSYAGDPSDGLVCAPEQLDTACSTQAQECGALSNGCQCASCGDGKGCFDGQCVDLATCPGEPCFDAFGDALCEGQKGLATCPTNADDFQVCTCGGGGSPLNVACEPGCLGDAL